MEYRESHRVAQRYGVFMFMFVFLKTDRICQSTDRERERERWPNKTGTTQILKERELFAE